MKNLNPLSTIPDWVRSTVFYQIFPDRYARSASVQVSGIFAPWGFRPTQHGFAGGNLRGIEENLDHIADLGANALYLCPIFSSTANHRYHTHDYFRIDPVLGSEKDFDNLLRSCHARGMRLVLDGVFNHCSRGFYPFNSVLEQGEESPYIKWFHIHGFPLNAYGRDKANYDCWWGLPALPKFNTANPEVREFLFSVGEYWVERGIDGWRLDVPSEINDNSFWQEFRRRVKVINPDAYIVGEIWENPARWLQGDQFDGVMNYVARKAILDAFMPHRPRQHGETYFSPPAGTSHDPVGFAQEQMQWAQRLALDLEAAFPGDGFGYNLNLLGSHDTLRLVTLAGENLPTPEDAFVRNPLPRQNLRKEYPASALMALTLLYMLPGAPCIFYGDEVGLEGGRDPDCRRCMPWNELTQNFREQEPYVTLQFFNLLRRQSRVLGEGNFGCRLEGEGFLVWRALGGERLELLLGWPGSVGIEPEKGKNLKTLYQRGLQPLGNQGAGLLGAGGILLRQRVQKGEFG